MAVLDGMDPDLASQIINPTLGIMMDAVQQFDGHTSSLLGDGLFAVFGTPTPHEDHAQRAIYAALRMHEKIRDHAARLTRVHGIPEIQIRIGINTGEMVLRSIAGGDGAAEYVATGHAAGVAARLESIATPGTTVISENTRRLVSGYFELRSIGEATIKGVSQNLAVHEVLGVSQSRSRLEALGRLDDGRFIGRTNELDQLASLLRMAEGGAGQIVSLVGEAGVGKSRLTYEFKRQIGDSCLVLEGAPVAHGSTSANFAVIDMLERYFEIATHDDDAVRLARVREAVMKLDPALEQVIPFLLSLLAISDPSTNLGQMDPGVRGQRTFDAIRSLILSETRERPVVLILEDLHWLDRDSRRFLRWFARAIADASVLLLVNYRPEHKPTWADDAGRFTQIRLVAFSATDAEALLEARVGTDPSLDIVKKLILDKTEGNPFFIEEYIQTMFDQGILSKSPDIVMQRSADEIQIPATVTGILAARIGMLPPDDKAILQLLAVFGMVIPRGVIDAALGGAEAEAQDYLNHLVAAEFIQEREALSEVEYVFRHALIRETAYGELLANTRCTLHARAATALEAYYSDRLGDHSSQLAYHYACAEMPERAIEFQELAAARSTARSAYMTAIRHLTEALTLVDSLDDPEMQRVSEMRLQAKIGGVRMATQGFAAPEVRTAFERAWSLCNDSTDNSDFIRVVGGLATVYINRGDLVSAQKMAEELRGLAERRHDDRLYLSAHDVLGMALLRAGELTRSRDHFALAMRRRRKGASKDVEDSLGRDQKSSAIAFGAMGRWLQGYSDRAIAQARFAVERAMRDSQDRPFTVFHALLPLLWIHHFRREAADAERQARQAVNLAEQHGLPLWRAHSHLILGWALAEQGDTQAGLDLIDTAEREYAATGGVVWSPFYCSMRAEALIRKGALAEASNAVESGLALLRTIGEYWWEAELHRLAGKLRLLLEPADTLKAREHFARAIAVAERQGATALELRARADAFRCAPNEPGRAALSALLERFPEGARNPIAADAVAALDAPADKPLNA